VKRAVERGSVASVEQREVRDRTGQDGSGQARPGQGKRWAERGGARRSNGPRARGLECAQIGTRKWRPREELQAQELSDGSDVGVWSEIRSREAQRDGSVGWADWARTVDGGGAKGGLGDGDGEAFVATDAERAEAATERREWFRWSGACRTKQQQQQQRRRRAEQACACVGGRRV
jgi:hypothetical protein